mgnify:CR=1 FL=1
MILKDKFLKLLKIYLSVGNEQRYTKVKEIHNFVKEYLLDWFPGLVSYQTLSYHLNRITGAVTELLKQLTITYKPADCNEGTMVAGSMPIMTCTERNRVDRHGNYRKKYSSVKNNVLPQAETAPRGGTGERDASLSSNSFPSPQHPRMTTPCSSASAHRQDHISRQDLPKQLHLGAAEGDVRQNCHRVYIFNFQLLIQIKNIFSWSY